ncbi:hypothetical protein SAMN04488511_11940 [Pedobacter suwonensis]|uniref:TonB protein C-terminal n=1 Tax=Pedobacter suwonensis TaxID=332999 RepID=A0A1I0U2Z7_9SPHI|nr:hypothetical protein [Pedobacter suwonensis]SFA58404.1 hypothetical protein SAMN04488511_11940 [Pedobacter suwonensis]
MQKQILLLISALILIAISQKAKAQDSTKINTLADTTIYDDKLSSEGHIYKFPLSPLSQAEYTQFTHNQYANSDVIKKNKLYTKLEVTTIVEKDGSVSKYMVKGTGTEAMKNEIVRILKLLPKNTPGTRDGQAARFRLHQPFEFKHE